MAELTTWQEFLEYYPEIAKTLLWLIDKEDREGMEVILNWAKDKNIPNQVLAKVMPFN